MIFFSSRDGNHVAAGNRYSPIRLGSFAVVIAKILINFVAAKLLKSIKMDKITFVDGIEIWAQFTDLRFKALLSAIEKTNPELREAYEMEIYNLSLDFLSTLPAHLRERFSTPK